MPRLASTLPPAGTTFVAHPAAVFPIRRTSSSSAPSLREGETVDRETSGGALGSRSSSGALSELRIRQGGDSLANFDESFHNFAFSSVFGGCRCRARDSRAKPGGRDQCHGGR